MMVWDWKSVPQRLRLRFSLRWLNGALIMGLVGFALIFVAASPLNKGNFWVDSNAMLTAGQYWLQGNVPYRDFFEQRGPVMFAYYLVANLFGTTGHLGLFVIEVLNLVGCWAITVKILVLFYPQRPILMRFLALWVPLLLVGSFAFETGGSPEEFAGLWQLVGLYAFEAWIRGKLAPFVSGLIIGGSFGLTFWIKYSLVGPWVAFAMLGLWQLVATRDWSATWRLAVGALIGVLAPTGLILGYFWLNQGLTWLIDVYFVTNLNAYGDSSLTLFGTVKRALKLTKVGLMNHPHLLDLVLVAFAIQLGYRRRYRVAISAVVIGLVTVILAFWSGADNVYMLVPTIIQASLLVALSAADGLTWVKRSVTVPMVWGSLLVLFWLPMLSNPFATAAPRIWAAEQTAAEQLGHYIADQRIARPTLLYANTVDFGVGRYVPLQKPAYIFEHTNVDDTKYPRQPKTIERLITHHQVNYVVWGMTWGNSLAVDPLDQAAIAARLPKMLLDHYRVVKVATAPIPRQGAMSLMSPGVDQLVLLAPRS